VFPALKALTRRNVLAAEVAAAVCVLVLAAGFGWAGASSNPVGPPAKGAGPTAPEAPAVPVAEQPPAKLVVDPPKPEPLARRVAFIQFRTENLQIVPVFGPNAATVSPRIGDLHVTVDDAPWHWAHTSAGPIIVADSPPGPHKVLIELADANHKALAQEVVKFEVPRQTKD
jgi:hypothetical protein